MLLSLEATATEPHHSHETRQKDSLFHFETDISTMHKQTTQNSQKNNHHHSMREKNKKWVPRNRLQNHNNYCCCLGTSEVDKDNNFTTFPDLGWFLKKQNKSSNFKGRAFI